MRLKDCWGDGIQFVGSKKKTTGMDSSTANNKVCYLVNMVGDCAILNSVVGIVLGFQHEAAIILNHFEELFPIEILILVRRAVVD